MCTSYLTYVMLSHILYSQNYAAACRLHKTGGRLNDMAKVQTTLCRRSKRPLLMILLGISQQMLRKLSLGQFASNNR